MTDRPKVERDSRGRLVVKQPGTVLKERLVGEYSWPWPGTNPDEEERLWTIVKAVRDYEGRHNLVSPDKDHLIEYGGIELVDPAYYPSATVTKIVETAEQILADRRRRGVKLSRVHAVAMAVQRLMPFDLATSGRKADRFRELTPMGRELGFAVVCRHAAPATVAALRKIGNGDFDDTVLVKHFYDNLDGSGHALAFIPSRGWFVDGQSGTMQTAREYLETAQLVTLGDSFGRGYPARFEYGAYDCSVPEGKKVMKFYAFNPLDRSTYPATKR